MKIEYVLPERERKEIEKYQKWIEEIKQSYIDECLRYPFRRFELEKKFRNDRRVQTFEKAIARIAMLSVGKYVVTAESEEDKERLREILESKKLEDG